MDEQYWIEEIPHNNISFIFIKTNDTNHYEFYYSGKLIKTIAESNINPSFYKNETLPFSQHCSRKLEPWEIVKYKLLGYLDFNRNEVT